MEGFGVDESLTSGGPLRGLSVVAAGRLDTAGAGAGLLDPIAEGSAEVTEGVLGSASGALVVVPRFPGLLAAGPSARAMKRAIDIVGSLVAIILTLPLMLIVALLVRSTSRGPTLFRQNRVGKDGRPFRILKFRSMYRNAHEARAEHADLNMHTGPIFKSHRDPRITPLGRVLRRASLDELPQLFNVLSGRMSLVGPRPPLPEEYAQYSARQRRRLDVKPGITCIWQVSGRSDVDFDTWVDMDLEYIQSWSLWLDLKLLARTLPAVLSARGAY
jgi:exopolysaccharide biosynthesis polyprenyl glycosylphosphotransferase